MKTEPTYYEILNLHPSLQQNATVSAQTLRNAYRRALLQNHPDKSSLNPSTSPEKPKYTVDQISEAFTILNDPKLRAKYDSELMLQNIGANGVMKSSGAQGFKTGVEVVDLDDLTFEEGEAMWYRSCRCGQERGFEVRERDLEDAERDGEVSVGCKGCSLWLRVLFGVVEEDSEERQDNGMEADNKG